MSPRTWRALAFVACLIVLSVALYRQFHDQLQTPASQLDFHDYYLGALAVRRDADPFAAAARWMRQFTPSTPYRTSFFIYAPFFALLLTPLTFLSFTGALLVWDACNVLFLVVAIYSFLRAADIRPSALSVLVLTTLGSLASPMRIEYYWGQSDVFLLMLICLVLWAYRERKVTVAGILLAVACMTKPPLLLLVVFFLWKRAFKLAIVTALATVAMVLAPFLWLGGQALGNMLTVWGFYSNQFIAIAYNDSPKGVLARLFVRNPVVHPLVNAPALMNGIWILLVLLVALLTASVVSPTWTRGDVRPLLETGLVVCAILLISPLTETNHFTLLLLPFLAFYALLRKHQWHVRAMRVLGIGTTLAWLALCLPIYEVQNVFVADMTRHAQLADLYVVLAPTYLYVAIAVFVFGRHVLRLTDGLAVPWSAWEFLWHLPLLLRQWLRDAYVALVATCRLAAETAAHVISCPPAMCRRQ